MISLILTIHNQEKILPYVLDGIDRASLITEYIVVFDGCTDTSEECFLNWYIPGMHRHNFKFIDADNVFETRANNLGLKEVTNPYAVIVQDDCAILEDGWDKHLLDPMIRFPKVFAVSGRNSHNIISVNDQVQYLNNTGWGTDKNNPNKFYMRQVVNRGPLLLKMDVVKSLNYFDEAFVPQNGDDHDLCMRAYKEGWLCGCTPINFRSDYEWGGTRKGNGKWIAEAIAKNQKIILERHGDLIAKDYPNEERDL